MPSALPTSARNLPLRPWIGSRLPSIVPGAAALLLALAVIATYSPVLSHKLLNYDDPANILLNPYLNPLTWKNIAQVWRQPYSGVYVPVTNMAFAAETWLAQRQRTPRDVPLDVNPRVYHAGNLLLHLSATLLVVMLLKQLTGSITAACVGGILFAVHPLQVEAVSWVTETKCLLCGVFGVAALVSYLNYLRAIDGLAATDTSGGSTLASSPQPSSRTASTLAARRRSDRRRAVTCGGWLLLASAAYLLALLSKPTAAALPFMAALLVVGWHWAGSWRNRAARAVPLAIWLLVALVLAALTKQQQPDVALDYVPSWSERPLIALDAIGFYLGKLIWPVGLSPDYAHSARAVLDAGWGTLNWIAPLGLVIALAAFRAPREVWVAAGLFVAGLLPVLGLVPFGYQSVSTVADRYGYLALIGPAVAVAWQFERFRTRAKATSNLIGLRCAWGAVVLVAAVLGLLANGQCRLWRDDLTLAEAGLRVSPNSAQLRSIRAAALENAGQREAALVEFEAMARAAPRSAMVRLNLGQAYERRGRGDDAARVYRETLALQANYAAAHLAYGTLLKRRGVLAEAMAHFDAARRIDPTSRVSRRELADTLCDLARPAQAIPIYRESLARRPVDSEMWDHLAAALAKSGDIEGAIAAYRQAIACDAEPAYLHNHLGSLFDGLNRTAEALIEYRQALELDSASADNQHNVGVALLKSGRPAEALPHFQAEVQQRPNDVNALFHLGTAYQRLGDPRAAASWFRAAIQRDPRSFAALVGLAGVATQLGDIDTAVAAYRQALPLEPPNAQVHNALGVLLAGRGQTREAAEQFTAALAIDPAYSEARANLERLHAGNR